MTHALPKEANASSPNRVALLALAHKYPRRLDDVYRAALASSSLRTYTIARAIASSALPPSEKRRLLAVGAEHAPLADRFEALLALRDLDPEGYVRLLVRTLDGLPSTPAEPYGYAPESRASLLAGKTGDPQVWAALLRAARRADIGLRLELIGAVAKAERDGGPHPERLAFLRAFLDDHAMPDLSQNPRMWLGGRVCSTYPPLEVRDVAAMTIGSLLKLETVPKPAWARAEWDAFQLEVARRLKLVASP